MATRSRSRTLIVGRAPRSTAGPVAADQFAGVVKSRHGLASDRQGKLIERYRQAQGHRRLDRQLVMPWTNVLDQGVAGDHDPGAAVLLEPAHRTQPRLETAVVALDPVAGIPIGAMPSRRQ